MKGGCVGGGPGTVVLRGEWRNGKVGLAELRMQLRGNKTVPQAWQKMVCVL